MNIATFDLNSKVLIVTEIGNNHEGDFDLARKLIDLAADAGADAVKFQTFRTEHYVSQHDRERFDRLKSFELNMIQFDKLSDHAKALNMLFFSTPFDLVSARELAGIADAIKISSGDITFLPLLRTVAASDKPLILSTGGANLDEIHAAVQTITDVRGNNPAEYLTLLHCVSAYPVPQDQANLKAILALADTFNLTIGYSDHTLGNSASVLAVAFGARIIEKHFTIDRNYSNFRDHQLSADPRELRDLVERIRKAEQLIGDGIKIPQLCECNSIMAMRRSMVASHDLAANTVLKRDDITWIRPGDGIAPGTEEQFIGATIQLPIQAGERLAPDMFLSVIVA